MPETKVVCTSEERVRDWPKRVDVESVSCSAHQAPKRNFVSVSVLVAITTWIVWLRLAGPANAIGSLVTHWEAAVTMIFGSIVAGGTSMGGGAVAFPVFTKVLQVLPHEAKVFSLAIQSVGMGAASLVIIAMRTTIEWRFIRWASLGGFPGLVLGSVFLAPMLPSDVIKLSFTMMVGSFGVVLCLLNRTDKVRHVTIPFWGHKARIFSLWAGLWGGTISGLVGSGMDIVCFSVLVLLFGMCEKVSTPTSVILMAINAIAGFVLHQFVLNDFTAPVTHYWLAAVPIVVVGAPIGAIICSSMNRKNIVRVLTCLVLTEVFSSFLLIPLSPTLFVCSFINFFFFTFMYYQMHRIKLYKVSHLVQAKR